MSCSLRQDKTFGYLEVLDKSGEDLEHLVGGHGLGVFAKVDHSLSKRRLGGGLQAENTLNLICRFSDEVLVVLKIN